MSTKELHELTYHTEGDPCYPTNPSTGRLGLRIMRSNYKVVTETESQNFILEIWFTEASTVKLHFP